MRSAIGTVRTLTTQQLERIKKPVYPAISGVDTVVGNVVPDGVKIKSNIGSKNIAAHAPDFRPVSDLCFSWARASAG